MRQFLISKSTLVDLESFQVYNQTVRSPLYLHLPRSDLLSVTVITVELVSAEHPLLVCELLDAMIE